MIESPKSRVKFSGLGLSISVLLRSIRANGSALFSLWFLSCVQDLHELFSCDGFVLVQIGRQLIQLTTIVFQNVQCFFMLFSNKLNDLFVNSALRFSGAGKRSIPAQILIRDGFHGDHVKVLAHPVAGDHGAGKLRSLLNVISGSGGNGTEHQFFRRPAAGEGCDLVFQLLLFIR